MSEENETPPPENQTPPAPPAPPTTPDTLVGAKPDESAWKEYESDPAKSAEENAAAKVEHDKSKPASAAPAAPAAPLTAADIEIPEGFTPVSDELRGEFVDLANELHMPKEGVSKLISLQAKVMQAASERVSAQFAEQQETFQRQVIESPDFGGPKLEQTLSKIESVISRFGDDEVRQVFAMTGAGNQLPMVRLFSKIADALGEPSPLPGGGPADAARENSEEARAARLYPSMKK